MVVMKKKFFFSDQNIDRNDPIQLNLLYVQSQTAIVKGTHPCTQDEAAQFGALQCQITFGNFDPDKHRPGFIKYVRQARCCHADLWVGPWGGRCVRACKG